MILGINLFISTLIGLLLFQVDKTGKLTVIFWGSVIVILTLYVILWEIKNLTKDKSWNTLIKNIIKGFVFIVILLFFQLLLITLDFYLRITEEYNQVNLLIILIISFLLTKVSINIWKKIKKKHIKK